MRVGVGTADFVGVGFGVAVALGLGLGVGVAAMTSGEGPDAGELATSTLEGAGLVGLPTPATARVDAAAGGELTAGVDAAPVDDG